MARVNPPGGVLVGLGVADERLSFANLSTGSSYSQQGPRPGSALPGSATDELVVQVSGEQSDTLNVIASKSGYPVLGDSGCRVTYTLNAEAATARRGWNPPNWACGWAALDHTSTNTSGPPAACVIPSSQLVVAIYEYTGSSGRVSTFDPFGASVSSGAADIDSATAIGTNPLWGIACWPEDERLIAVLTSGSQIGDVYESTDSGTTWALTAERTLRDASLSGWTSAVRQRLIVSGPDLLLMRVGDPGGGTYRMQYWVSTDRGSSFAFIETANEGASGSPDVGFEGVPDVVALPSGRIGWVTKNPTSNRPQVRVCPYPGASFAGAAPVDVDDTITVTELASWVDQLGSWYVMGRTSGDGYLWRSDDEGATWVAFDCGPFATLSASDYPSSLTPVSAGGGAHLVYRGVSSTTTWDQSVSVLTLGGWSQLTANRVATTIDDIDGNRIGFGATSVSGVDSAVVWVPIASPNGIGSFTATGAGSGTVNAGGYMVVTTAAQQRYYDPTDTLASSTQVVGVWDVKVVSGGSVTTDDVAIRVASSTGANGCDISVRFSTTQIRVYDNLAAATLATVSVDTTLWLQVMVVGAADNGLGPWVVAYRRPGETDWTIVYAGGANYAALAAGMARWGHIASGTATSRWRFVALAYGSSVWTGNGINYAAHNTTTYDYDDPIGGRLTARPFPIGDEAAAGATFLRAVDGPARMSETHTIAPTYDYPADRVCWEVSPSPDVRWRTAAGANSTQVFEWIPSGAAIDTAIGRSRALALVVLRSNVRAIEVYGDDGGGYDLLGEYNGAVGFTSLTADIDGDQVTPNSGTADGARYLHRNELVGGVFTDNGGDKWEIVGNEEGHWTGSTSARQARLTLREGATPAGGSGCSITSPNGVLIVPNLSPCRKWKISIAWADTPDDYIEIGQLVLMGLIGPGMPWDWGWSRKLELNSTLTENSSRTQRRKSNGRPPGMLSFAWPGGVPLGRIRGTTAPDVLSQHSSHTPWAAVTDVPWLVEGWVRQSDSGRIPVLAVAAVPQVAGDRTITDPTLWCYGLLSSDLTYTHVAGPTGSRELVRVETLTITEQV